MLEIINDNTIVTGPDTGCSCGCGCPCYPVISLNSETNMSWTSSSLGSNAAHSCPADATAVST